MCCPCFGVGDFFLDCRTAALKRLWFYSLSQRGKDWIFIFFFACVATGFLPRDVLLAFFRARVQDPLLSFSLSCQHGLQSCLGMRDKSYKPLIKQPLTVFWENHFFSIIILIRLFISFYPHPVLHLSHSWNISRILSQYVNFW